MKSLFLFYGDMKQFFTTHTDKYRMNDVTIIYRIGPLNILIWEFRSLWIRIYSNEFINNFAPENRHPILDVLNTLLIRKVFICFYFTLWKTKNLIKTLFIEQ